MPRSGPYSAQIKAEYNKYVRMFGTQMSLRGFAELYWEREQGRAIKIPKAVDAMFTEPPSDEAQRIREMIDRFNAEQTTKLGAFDDRGDKVR